jgi:hypothetical protein
MLLALLLLCQDRVELKEFPASYLLTKPAAYTDRRSWPVVWDLRWAPKPVSEPDAFVISPLDRMDERFVQAALADVKSKYRINPECVIALGNHTVLQFISGMSELFSGIAVNFPRAFPPPNASPPCVFFLAKSEKDNLGGIVAAMVMKKRGIDVELREWADRPGAVLEALSQRIRPRGDLSKADELQRSGRYLDASLLCIDLLDNHEVEKLAQTKLKSIEGAAIMELAKVEIAMADKKYKDAILRCRNAARQFAWVPTGERIRKRLAELESRPEIQRALKTDD